MNTYQRAILQRMRDMPPLPIGAIWPQQQYRTLRRALQRMRQMGYVDHDELPPVKLEYTVKTASTWWITPLGHKMLDMAEQEEEVGSDWREDDAW